MRFFEVSEHDLQDARPGLMLVEQLLKDDNFVPYFYGLTTKADVLYACQSAIEDDAGRDDDDNAIEVPQLTQVAVAIPFGADTIYYLAGSGLSLQNEDFAYATPSEGARTLSLRWGRQRPRVHLTDFTKMALSDSDMDLDEFLKQYATKLETPTKVTREQVPAVKASSHKASLLNPIDRFLAD